MIQIKRRIFNRLTNWQHQAWLLGVALGMAEGEEKADEGQAA